MNKFDETALRIWFSLLGERPQEHPSDCVLEFARRLVAKLAKPASEPDGEVVAGTGSLNDLVVIKWISDYHPKVGDKIYAAPNAAAQEVPVEQTTKQSPGETTADPASAAPRKAMTTQTPRTDTHFGVRGNTQVRGFRDDREFAQKLERELSALERHEVQLRSRLEAAREELAAERKAREDAERDRDFYLRGGERTRLLDAERELARLNPLYTAACLDARDAKREEARLFADIQQLCKEAEAAEQRLQRALTELSGRAQVNDLLQQRLELVERENRELKEGWKQAKLQVERDTIERCITAVANAGGDNEDYHIEAIRALGTAAPPPINRVAQEQVNGLNLPRTESAVNHSEPAPVAAPEIVDEQWRDTIRPRSQYAAGLGEWAERLQGEKK